MARSNYADLHTLRHALLDEIEAAGKRLAEASGEHERLMHMRRPLRAEIAARIRIAIEAENGSVVQQHLEREALRDPEYIAHVEALAAATADKVRAEMDLWVLRAPPRGVRVTGVVKAVHVHLAEGSDMGGTREAVPTGFCDVEIVGDGWEVRGTRRVSEGWTPGQRVKVTVEPEAGGRMSSGAALLTRLSSITMEIAKSAGNPELKAEAEKVAAQADEALAAFREMGLE